MAQTNEDLGKIEALLIELKEQLGPSRPGPIGPAATWNCDHDFARQRRRWPFGDGIDSKEKEEELSSRLEVHQGRLDEIIAASQEAERDRQVIQKEAKELEQLLAEKARNLEQQQAAANDLRAQIRLIGGELEPAAKGACCQRERPGRTRCERAGFGRGHRSAAKSRGGGPNCADGSSQPLSRS